MKIGVQIHPQGTTTAAMREAWQTADAMGVDFAVGLGPLLSALR